MSGEEIRTMLDQYPDAMQLVDAVLDREGPFGQYKMSFGLEFSDVVDWVADFTPRRNHPHARDYGDLRASDTTRDGAIRKAFQRFAETLTTYPR
jgi:hypothetical protein